MKSILDPTFKYVQSSKTDIRKTFERIKKEQTKNKPVPVVSKIRQLNNLKSKTN